MGRDKRGLLLVGLVLLIAGALTVFGPWRGEARERVVASPEAEASVVTDAGPDLVVAGAATGSAGAVASVPADGRTAATVLEASSDEALEDDEAIVRGRCLMKDGQPIVGATVYLHGWGRGHDATLKYGKPENWVNPSVETDEDGRFELRFSSWPSYQYFVRVHGVGFAERAWRWLGFDPGQVRDLGDQAFSIPGRVIGRVLDAAGNPRVGERWSVSAYFRSGSVGHSIVTPDTAEFQVTGLPPGRLEVSARSRFGDSTATARVALKEGESSSVDLTFAGDLSSGDIRVRARAEAFFVLKPELEHIHLFGPGIDGSRTLKETYVWRSENWKFTGLEEGLYTVEVNDPRFAPAQKTNVALGDSVSFKLKGSATLLVDVRDPEGNSIDEFELFAEVDNRNGTPREFKVKPDETQIPGAPRRFSGVPAYDYTLRVQAQGAPKFMVALDPLAPGEERLVQVNFPRATRIAGVVRNERGDRLNGANVELLVPATMNDSDDSPILASSQMFVAGGNPYRTLEASVTTNERGAYQIEGFFEGAFILRATNSGVGSHGLELAFSAEPTSITRDLVIQSKGTLEGCLVGLPAGESFEGLLLKPVPLDIIGGGFRGTTVGEVGLSCAIESDGRFQIDLASGEWTPTVVCGTRPGELPPTAQFMQFPKDGFVIRPGETTTRELDAAELWPASVVVAVTSPASLAGATFTLGDRTSKLDDAGLVRFDDVLVGAWAIQVAGHGGAWRHVNPEKFTVQSGVQNEFTLEVPLASGELTFFDAKSGELLVGAKLILREKVRPLGGTRFSTDDQGRANATLSPGHYVVLRAGGNFTGFLDSPPTAPLEWTASGPSVWSLWVPRLKSVEAAQSED